MLYIHKASAGSGKTYNLAHRYLTYLLADKREDGTYRLRQRSASHHQRLLAITFTNKATAEMARRIIKDLATIAHHDPCTEQPAIVKEFTALLGCTATELRDSAQAALADLLFDYSYFNISTIDSFFQTVLRLFSREIDVPDTYGVDLDLDALLSVAVDEMFKSLSYKAQSPVVAKNQEWVRRWLAQHLHEEVANGKGINLFNNRSAHFSSLVKELGAIIDKEKFKNNLTELTAYFADRSLIVKARNALLATDCGAATLREQCTSTLEAIERTDAKMINANWRKLVAKMASATPEEMTKESKTAVTVSVDGWKGFNKAGERPDNIALAHRFESLAGLMLDVKNQLAARKPIAKGMTTLGMLWVVNEIIDEYTRENNIMLLGNTTNLLSGIINDSETPFVYEKLGYYLDHFLIDEFQDTSPMQWNNLRPLVTEGLSRGKDSLIIGDEKQSIYRFRGSDPRLLGHQVQDDITARFTGTAMVDVEGTRPGENNNWRSSREIITFNNSLFHSLVRVVASKIKTPESRQLLLDTYANVEQHIHPSRGETPQGYVRVKFYDEDDSGDKTAAAKDDVILDDMVNEIARQLSAGYNARDIAILVDTNDHAHTVIDHLMKCMGDGRLPQCQIMSADALQLQNSRAVQHIISLLRLTAIPDIPSGHDDEDGAVKTARMLAFRRAHLAGRYSHLRQLQVVDPATGENRYPTPGEALVAALEEARAADPTQVSATLAALTDMKCYTLTGVLQRIIDTLVPHEVIEQDFTFVSSLQDAVMEYTTQSGHDIDSFLSWWDRGGKRTAVVSPENINAITVSTIHKAKGLEYPCVHVPYNKGPLASFKSPEWFEIDRQALAERFGLDPETVPPLLPLRVIAAYAGDPVLGGQYDALYAQAAIDTINDIYVAYTRPTRELLVYVAAASKEGESIESFIEQAIAKAETSEWRADLPAHCQGRDLVIGEPTAIASSPVEPLAHPPVPQAVTGNGDAYQSLLAFASADIDSPRDVMADMRRQGIFLHDVMRITRNRNDLLGAFNRIAHRYYVPDEGRDVLYCRLEKMLSSQWGKRWFDASVVTVNEQSLSTGTGGRMRRPDRVVIFPDGTVEVVDYKFVEHLPADLENDSTHRRYCHTLGVYCRGVARALGVARAKGYLWYTDPSGDSLVVQAR